LRRRADVLFELAILLGDAGDDRLRIVELVALVLQPADGVGIDAGVPRLLLLLLILLLLLVVVAVGHLNPPSEPCSARPTPRGSGRENPGCADRPRGAPRARRCGRGRRARRRSAAPGRTARGHRAPACWRGRGSRRTPTDRRSSSG